VTASKILSKKSEPALFDMEIPPVVAIVPDIFLL
jgi:hypothetical protein